MALIELYISKSQRGYRNLLSINPSAETARHIHDYGEALSIVQFDHSIAQTFHLISYTDKGLLLAVIRTIAQENDNHLAATLFIPYGAKLHAETLKAILDEIEKFLAESNNPTPASVVPIRALLSMPVNVENVPRHMPSSGHAYAMVRYDGANLPSFNDYIAHNFYQSLYADFSGVLMCSAKSNATAKLPSHDISSPKLAQGVTVLPPAKSREGFAPYVVKSEFSSPRYAELGGTMEIAWRRPGFESVNQQVKIDRDNIRPETPDTSQAHKIISPSSFFVTQQGTQIPVGAITIKVNGIEIDSPKSFTCSELINAKVEISSPHYIAYSGRFDLAGTTQALVQLRPMHKTYIFALPLVTPEPVEAVKIYLRTRRRLHDCPIEGYRVIDNDIQEGSGKVNQLEYAGGNPRKSLLHKAVSAAIGFIVGILVAWFAFSVSSDSKRSHAVAAVPDSEQTASAAETSQSDNTPSATESALAEAPAQESEPTATPIAEDIRDAVTYLDSHKNWNKSEMEEFPAISGLFDDLNSYNFDKLLEHWSPVLHDSANFAAVVRAVKGAAGKRDPRTGAHTPTYNKSGDTAINWISYTYWIDP